MRADLPFEYRWLGDNSITEGYAMLFDHLLHDAGWLLRYSALGRARVGEYRRAAAFEELQFLRRYSAKLLYELELYGGATSHGRRCLTRTSRSCARPRRSGIARPTRSWTSTRGSIRRGISARGSCRRRLREVLVAQFDDDWYRNPRAGPWIVRELFGEGQRELASELAERVGAPELSFDPVITAIEAGLSA